jgi:hypothetical protein
MNPDNIPPGKTRLVDADVFIHVPAPDDSASVTHIDVCHPAVAEIVQAGDDDATYFGTTSCGGFVGLRKPMIRMAKRKASLIRESDKRWDQCTNCGRGWDAAQNINYCPNCGQDDPTVDTEAVPRQ